MVGIVWRPEGALQFRLETFEGLLLRPRLVAPYQVADVFTDILVIPGFADIG